jgi:type II secretory pathway predicted ATPase ExeA
LDLKRGNPFMYYEYWDLKKPPFDNVPDPSMYVDSHTSVENAIAETLFSIEEGDDCIAVIVGDVGVGKTLSLRLILDSLDQQKYKIAFITNPDMPFVQLLREIIGQLTGEECEIKRKVTLLEIFNNLLFRAIDEGKKVIIFIDEANAISPTNLESLRLLTNMQDDNRNLFTIVLAGQMELARRLEHPKRANLFQRVGTYNRIDKIQSENMVKDYVETRLKLAGGNGGIFTDDAISCLWEYSEYGVPRLINKICKLCLKAGETNRLDKITGEVLEQVGERFQRLTGPVIEERKPRERGSVEINGEQIDFQDDKQQMVSLEAEDKILIPIKGEPEIVVSQPREEKPAELSEEDAEKAKIGKFKIGKINIPSHIIREAKASTKEHRTKLAGVLAAQILKKYPQLVKSIPSADPVSVWSETKDLILNKLEQEIETVTQ